jgi:hypothetical protein
MGQLALGDVERELPREFEVFAVSDHAEGSDQMRHRHQQHGELTPEHVARGRELRIRATWRWRVSRKHQRSGPRQSCRVVPASLDRNAIPGMAGAITTRVAGLKQCTGDGAVKRQVAIQRTPGDLMVEGVEEASATQCETHEQCDSVRGVYGIELAVDRSGVGLDCHGDGAIAWQSIECLVHGGSAKRRSLAAANGDTRQHQPKRSSKQSAWMRRARVPYHDRMEPFVAAIIRVVACSCAVAMFLASEGCSNRHSPPAANGGARAGEGGSGASGGTGGGGSISMSGTTECETAADCGYGEIDHEIEKKSDCICLFGCPHLPLNKTTIERRGKSYQALCDPKVDGKGDRCPIDDCVQLPTPVCDNHVCRAAPKS